MKKVIKSRAALNARALHNGATVTNKPESKKHPGKKTALKKKQETPKLDTSTLVAEAVEKQTSELRMLLEGLKEQMATIKLQYPDPITSWDFNLVRNIDGSVKTIEARVPVRVLN